MAIVTLRPNGTFSNGWSTNHINAASHHAAQSDNNPSGVGSAYDASGLSYSIGVSGSELILDMGTYTLPSTQRVENVRLRIWNTTQTSGMAFIMNTYIWDGAAYIHALSQNQSNTTITEYASSWFGSTVAGGEWLQSNINFLFTRFVDGGGPTSSRVFETFIDLDVRSQPSVTNISATPASHRPIISWTYNDPDAGAMGAYQVKVFSSSQYGAPGFNPATSGAYYSSAANSDLPSHQISGIGLPNGTYRAYVIAAKWFRGQLWWSSQSSAGPYVTFTISDAPPAPTQVGPNSNEVVATDTPTLRANALNSTTYQHAPVVKVQWTIAQDANFTTGVQTILEPSTAYRNAGPSTMVVPENSKLFQRVDANGNSLPWYLKARQVDFFGAAGPFSPTTTFIVYHPPTTSNHTPAGDQTLAYGENGQVTFLWTASNQVSFQIIIERLSDGLQILNETQTTAEAGSTTTSGAVQTTWTIAIPASYKDTPLRWKVRVTDVDGVTGPYSSYNIFRVSDTPTLVIASPAEGANVNNPSPEVTWTFAATAGRSQRQYQVFYEKNGVVVFDSGLITNASTTPFANTLTYTPTSAIYSNGDSGRVRVVISDTTQLTASDSKNFTVSYTPPATPAFDVDSSQYNSVGYVGVTWTRAPDGSFTNWRIYRRLEGTEVWQKLYETEVAGSGTGIYQDWAVGSGNVYEYAVVQEAERFGVKVESAYSPQTGSGTSTEYWLIHPSDNAKNFHLFHVTEDQFAEEYEFQNMLLLGRGRKTDYGTRVGYLGSLTASLYDVSGGPSARTQRLALEALKAERTFVYLRNPFGDLWAVTTSDIQITRTAGVGSREFATVSIPYQEVLGTNILR